MTETWALTSFEHMMVADDRPEYPMTFWLRFTVAGVVDGPRLVAAVRAAVERHPLLGSRLVGTGEQATASLRWERDRSLTPLVDVAADGTPLGFPHAGRTGIDLARETGFRLFVRQRVADSTWLLQLHHAACDGLGGLGFMEDVFALYGSPAAPALKPLTPAALNVRGDYHLAPGERRRRLGKDLGRTLLYVRRRPAPLAPRPAATRPAAGPASVVRELPEAELTALRRAARVVDATVNDLLLADLFLTLDAWNRGQGSARRPVRLAMPLSMRLATDRTLPAANVVSMCFLDRAGAAFDDPESLTLGVARETRTIKANGLGHALLLVTDLAGRFRGGMRALMTRRPMPACAATAVVSNLGEAFQANPGARGVELLRAELLPPLRPETALAVGVVTLDGRLALTLHHDPAQLDAAGAAWIGDALVARLAERTASLPAAAALPSATADGPLLDRLIAEHRVKRQGAAAFRSLPIGRGVATLPVLEAMRALPPAGTDSAGTRLRHQDAHEVRGADHSA